MRVELHGCEYRDGLLSYSLSHLPSSANAQEDFTDETFEQTDDLDSVYQTQKGLGLLTDGIISKHPPVDPLYRLPYRNSTWLGWSKNETDGKLDIRFVFDHDRHFSELEVYGFGSPIKQIEVEFSMDNAEYGHQVVSKYPKELENVDGRHKHYSIRVPLDQTGQFVRIKMLFDTDWLYLSEMRFGTGIYLKIVLLNLHLFRLRRRYISSSRLLVKSRRLWFILCSRSRLERPSKIIK
jgi:hypothetical protein